MFAILLLLLCAFSTAAGAESYTAYNNLSSTYTNYYRDIVGGLGFNDHYVHFRSDQYTYILVTGALSFDNGIFRLEDSGKIYTIVNTTGTQNNYQRYSVRDINDFTLIVEDKIVYSDLGNYPQFEERGQGMKSLTRSCFAFFLLLVLFVVFSLSCFAEVKDIVSSIIMSWQKPRLNTL